MLQRPSILINEEHDAEVHCYKMIPRHLNSNDTEVHCYKMIRQQRYFIFQVYFTSRLMKCKAF